MSLADVLNFITRKPFWNCALQSVGVIAGTCLCVMQSKLECGVRVKLKHAFLTYIIHLF